jgi:hypothetical protein
MTGEICATAEVLRIMQRPGGQPSTCPSNNRHLMNVREKQDVTRNVIRQLPRNPHTAPSLLHRYS